MCVLEGGRGRVGEGERDLQFNIQPTLTVIFRFDATPNNVLQFPEWKLHTSTQCLQIINWCWSKTKQTSSSQNVKLAKRKEAALPISILRFSFPPKLRNTDSSTAHWYVPTTEICGTFLGHAKLHSLNDWYSLSSIKHAPCLCHSVNRIKNNFWVKDYMWSPAFLFVVPEPRITHCHNLAAKM